MSCAPHGDKMGGAEQHANPEPVGSPLVAFPRGGRYLDIPTVDDIHRFQLHLAESGISICNRNRIMTGVKFLLRVTLRRLDLAAEVYHLHEPQTVPQVMSPDETRRVLAV